jgi:hypothetical protein
MISETRLRTKDHDSGTYEENWVTGYFMTLDDIVKICQAYIADNRDGFISNNKAYLESKLKEL